MQRHKQYLRRWLILPLAWLLLLNALALPGKMPPPAPASHHADMAMTGMPHSACHTQASDHCGAPSLPHCNHPSTCNLCHASPALVTTGHHLSTPAAIIDRGWQTPLYTSIVTTGLDRPPALLLA